MHVAHKNLIMNGICYYYLLSYKVSTQKKLLVLDTQLFIEKYGPVCEISANYIVLTRKAPIDFFCHDLLFYKVSTL